MKSFTTKFVEALKSVQIFLVVGRLAVNSVGMTAWLIITTSTGDESVQAQTSPAPSPHSPTTASQPASVSTSSSPEVVTSVVTTTSVTSGGVADKDTFLLVGQSVTTYTVICLHQLYPPQEDRGRMVLVQVLLLLLQLGWCLLWWWWWWSWYITIVCSLT